MKDVIIIPTYNERENITYVVGRVRRECPSAEIIVVDDNSPDGTAEIVRSLTKQDQYLRLVSRPGKQGLGEAYKDILSRLQSEQGIRNIVTMDADGSHDPSAIPILLKKLDTVDLVVGSRYVRGGKIEGWSRFRHLLSFWGNVYTRTITGSPIHDGTAGFVAFRASVLKGIDFRDISGAGYAYQIEFKNAIIKNGGAWKEIPITFIERKLGVSKISSKIVGEGLGMPWRILWKGLRAGGDPRWRLAFFVSLIILAALSLSYMPHRVAGTDAVSYLDAIHVLNGAPLSVTETPAYVISRIMNTFLNLESVNLLSVIFGNLLIAWLVWGTFMYFLINIIFYRLLRLIFGSIPIACLGGLFFASNYALLVSGLSFYMDIGGWTFFILSVYFLYTHVLSRNRQDLWLAALAISVGAFFKEYALTAYVPLFFVTLYHTRHSFRTFLQTIVPLSLVAFFPILVHYTIVYLTYGADYVSWIRFNRATYVYDSRLKELVKSLGSLLTFLSPLALLGIVAATRELWKMKGEKDEAVNREYVKGSRGAQIVFVASLLFAALPALVWPAIIQRVLFMTVPGLVVLACYGMKKYEHYLPLYLILLVLYAACSFFMDSFILTHINLPF
jgi:dolichol-phosphate mannosyltransferase